MGLSLRLLGLVLLLALHVSNNDVLNQQQQQQQQQQILHSENSNKKNNRIIKATTRNDARPNKMNMVGGYSSILDINLPEIINVVNFVRNELLVAMKSQIPVTTTSSSGNDGTTTSATTLHNTIVPQQIIEAAAAAQQNNDTNNTINIEVRKVQRQVVAGMNYKLTLAINIMNNSNNIIVPMSPMSGSKPPLTPNRLSLLGAGYVGKCLQKKSSKYIYQFPVVY